jgi:hypothetical protein
MRRTQLGERMALRLSRGLQAMIGARTIATAALCCGLGCLGVGLEPWRDTDSPPPRVSRGTFRARFLSTTKLPVRPDVWAVSPNQNVIAAGVTLPGGDTAVHLYGRRSGRLLTVLASMPGQPRCMAWSRSSTRLAVATSSASWVFETPDRVAQHRRPSVLPGVWDGVCFGQTDDHLFACSISDNCATRVAVISRLEVGGWVARTAPIAAGTRVNVNSPLVCLSPGSASLVPVGPTVTTGCTFDQDSRRCGADNIYDLVVARDGLPPALWIEQQYAPRGEQRTMVVFATRMWMDTGSGPRIPVRGWPSARRVFRAQWTRVGDLWVECDPGRSCRPDSMKLERWSLVRL